jgi:acyl carrier protein
MGGERMSELTEKVMDIVCKQLNVSKDKLNPETSFVNDLSADSLDLVELVMELEDQFGVSIPDEDAEKIQTIGDAIKYVESHSQ